jgi:antitoxin YefM
MRATTTTELRANLARMIDQVIDDHTPLLITRAGGANAVLISEEEFAAIDETLYLLRSPKNAAELRASIAELDAGQGVVRQLIEE